MPRAGSAPRVTWFAFAYELMRNACRDRRIGQRVPPRRRMMCFTSSPPLVGAAERGRLLTDGRSHRATIARVSASTLPVRADFVRDVREQLASRLRLSAVPLPPAPSADDVAVRYFDFKRRQIPARTRGIVRSREFDQRALTTDLQAGASAIIEDSVAGRSLLPYFSKTWLNLDCHDILFNDWHVCHLHLGGRTIGPDGFVARTGPVLFVYPTHDDLYLIDIMEHGIGHPTTFACRRIVQILHDNWPKLVEHGRMHNVSNISPNDDESRRLLSRRRKGPHMSLGVETSDGTVYGLIGGGYMMTGLSFIARRMADGLLNDAHRLQMYYSSIPTQIQEDIIRARGTCPDELHLRVDLKHVVRGLELAVREVQSQVVLLHGRRISFPRHS